MEKYAIIAEVPKLEIPLNCSIKITDFKNDFFLYPHSITNTLKKINQDIKNYKNVTQIDSMFSKYIDTNKEALTYFISEITLNINQMGVEILEEIKNHFKYLLNLFSLLLREMFFIKKIYIFKKTHTFYKFIRSIRIPVFHKELSGIHRLYEFLSLRDLEFFFPVLLLRLKKNRQYLSFIEEFLFSRIRAGNIIIKFMVSWNTLEHLTNIYWKLRKQTKLFFPSKSKKINKVIRKKIKSFKEKDKAFPFISLKEIRKKVSFYNRPSILTLIFELCRKIHLNLDKEEILTIKKVHFIRNKLFHSLYAIQDINKIFIKEFKLKEFQNSDYGLILAKFNQILEKIMLRLFRFTPICIKVENYNNYVHYFKWKKIRAFSKIPSNNTNQINYHSINNKQLTAEDKNNFFLKHFLKEKQRIFFRGRYLPLLKFLNRFNKKIKNIIENSSIIGEVNTKFHGKRKISLQFEKNLKGIYSYKRENDNTGVGIGISPTQFKSLPFKEGTEYQLNFEFFNIEETIQLSSGFVDISGKFFTLLLDINII